MKKIILLLLFSIILFSTNSNAINFEYNGMILGEEIADYSYIQFKYDNTKIGIDYYTANSSTNDEVTRMAVYNKKLLSVDITNYKSYILFSIATVQLLEQEYGKPDYSFNRIDSKEIIWRVDPDHDIIVIIDNKNRHCTLSFFSVNLFKQYLNEIKFL